MTKSNSIEKKIKKNVEDVEQQYAKLQDDINKINKEGERLAQLLNRKLQEGMKLKGEYKALVALLPKKERPAKKLSENKPNK